MSTYDRDWEPPDDFLDDFDGTIRNPRFGFRDDYMEGTRLLAILPIIVLGMDKPVETIYSLGDGWQPSGDGKFCSHPSDPDKVPSKNTIYGKLMVRVGKELNPEMMALNVNMRTRGSSKDIRVWEGLRFHWKREKLAYKGKAFEDKGGSIEPEHLMPTKFLGLETSATAPTVAIPGAAPVAPTSSNQTEDRLRELILTSPELKDFQMAAMRLPDVVTDERLCALVLDTGPAGFWSTHKK